MVRQLALPSPAYAPAWVEGLREFVPTYGTGKPASPIGRADHEYVV